MKLKYFIAGIFLLVAGFMFVSEPVMAVDLNSISGSVRWGTEVPPNVSIDVQGSLGYHNVLSGADYDTGFNLPDDSYTITASIKSDGGSNNFVIGNQVVAMSGGQSATGVNFDASAVSGLVKGTLQINGVASPGAVQFCSPVVTDPCPIGFTAANGPFYFFNSTGFSVPMLPGDYRVHVKTVDHVDVGIVSVTVVAGQENSPLSFNLNLGSISGSVRWDSQTFLPDEVSIDVQGQTQGYHNIFSGSDFDTGLNLPADTYAVTATMKSEGGTVNFVIGNQSVVVGSGQSVTGVNFDASTVSGLVKGDFKINGTANGGMVQFCSPVVTDPCPIGFTAANGSHYTFGTSGFRVPLLPGDYRVHVKTVDHVDIGIIPVTVIAGQETATLHFELNFGSISGSVRWDTEVPPNVSVDVQGATQGYHNVFTSADFSTGTNLPDDTYTVTASINSDGGTANFVIGSQEVVISGGQTVTGINFDASTVSGLVKGVLYINDVASPGAVQFCSPVITDPCPIGFTAANGPFYFFNSTGFNVPMLPGDYRVHVKTVDHVEVGIIPVTVVAGQVINLSFGESPIITTTDLADTTEGASYLKTIEAEDGTTPYMWNVLTGSLPDGLNLNSSTGEILGVSTSAGIYNFTVQVIDASSQSDTQDLTIIVHPAPEITTTTLTDGTRGLAYSQTIESTGGMTALVWSFASGSLPVGLSLDSATGEIYGTPTTAGTSNFTVQVTDANGAIDTQALTITINLPAPVVITLTATGDTYLRQGAANQNEGTDTLLNIQTSGKNRSLVQFDEQAIETAVGTGTLVSATLQLNIQSNGNNWGASGRDIAVHRLTQTWTELGATWNCAIDTNTANSAPNCASNNWNMNTGDAFVSAPTDSATITNGLSGIISFDVTSDAQSFLDGFFSHNGWIIKKSSETAAGQVGFDSRETSSDPVLVLTVQN